MYVTDISSAHNDPRLRTLLLSNARPRCWRHHGGFGVIVCQNGERSVRGECLLTGYGVCCELQTPLRVQQQAAMVEKGLFSFPLEHETCATP